MCNDFIIVSFKQTILLSFSVSEYVQIAKEKYRYNPEQALGILFWHGFDFECALSDLSNFLPYPDEWTMEDKALFEQAHQFYNKNFLKINTLLPDKKISSLIKYYYTKWKILKCVKDPSYIQKQINRKPFQNKDGSNGSPGNNADKNTDIECVSPNRQACALCQTRTRTTDYFNTNQGVVCRSCFVEKSKDGNINANGNNDEGYFEDENKVLPNGMTKMILDKKVLVEIAREREANISRKAVELLELDIADVIRKIREHKQQNASIKESLVEFPDLIGLNVSHFCKIYKQISNSFFYSKIITAPVLDGTTLTFSFSQKPFQSLVVILRQSLKFLEAKLKIRLRCTILQIRTSLKT